MEKSKKELAYENVCLKMFGRILSEKELSEMIHCFPGFGVLILNVIDPVELGMYWKREYGRSWREEEAEYEKIKRQNRLRKQRQRERDNEKEKTDN